MEMDTMEHNIKAHMCDGGLSDIDVAKVDGRPSLVVVTHCSFPCSADVRRMPVLIINYISDNLHIALPEYS